MKKYIEKFSYSMLAFLMFGFGISLQIKADIGQSIFNSFCMLGSNLASIEIGTMINVFNFLFFLVYLILKAGPPKLKDIIQIAAIMINGIIINIFTYGLLNHIAIESYPLKVITFALGLILASISLGLILSIGIIQFPLEGLCIILSEKLKYSLGKIRMSFDIFFLTSTLIITMVTKQPLFIREGTIISFFLLSKMLGVSYGFFKDKKLSFIQNTYD
ncbi:MAG: YczE/YyaS/YitT family protein [Solirubrobacterales bacterium]